jgi:integrating conjugative element protein (TIGR03749 family)
MKHFVSLIGACFILLVGVALVAHADAIDKLTLTDSEMQKLKKYFPNEDLEHLVWKGDPITISLPIGKEKRIIFPCAVSVDVKGALNTDQLRIINDNKSLYLTALKNFSTTRIYIKLQESGEVLLIDLTASQGASSSPQQIDIKSLNIANINNSDSQIVISNRSGSEISEKPTYVDMIRFSWQQMYAPKRLLVRNINYSRAPMHTQRFVSDLVYGDKVIAYPISSWVFNNTYVTAVFLRNKYPHKTYIDVSKDLCGAWHAATVYPRSILQPRGNKEKDSTILFLISNRTFGEVLGVCHGDA